ncbi:hypothetical protein [Tateyamaria pelophila]|uniref:hypothetical protein n=1 Tax=Tateyamaria pelophila TaxID=328415 RepID=UPI001CBAF3A1|nr:hypothetical protein [Tateyamaria pelophila]
MRLRTYHHARRYGDRDTAGRSAGDARAPQPLRHTVIGAAKPIAMRMKSEIAESHIPTANLRGTFSSKPQRSSTSTWA